MSSIIELFLSCFVIFYLHKSYAVDTMTVAESLTDGDTLTSAGGIFKMGFFSPGNSTNRYVGIWYTNASVLTVVWVANRQFPLTKNSGVLQLVRNRNLIILDSIQSNNTIWSSSSSSSSSSSHISKKPALNPVLQLLDSGNLVIRDENDQNPENFHWQSFDHPVDTLLPGMKLGINFKTGLETYLSSWKTSDDPSPGDYNYRFDYTGYPQLIMRKKSVISFRLGSWNGLGFSGIPISKPAINASYKIDLIVNENEVSYTYNLVNKSSTFSKLSITPSGTAQRISFVKQTKSWRVLFTAPADHCDEYSRCGAYSTCSLLCQCLDKFTPRNQKEWEVNDGSSGCVRVKNLECKTDGFRKYSGLKLPDTRFSWFDKNMNLEECEMKCLKNCSCMAYARLNILEGSGCLIWFGDLVDMKDLSVNVQDIYVRMASSDSDHTVLKSSDDKKKKVMIKVLLPLVFGTLIMVMSLMVCYLRKKKRTQMNMEGRLRNINETRNEDMELQLFALQSVIKATKNFSLSCKLGEGGFGPVYKGILGEGQEVAVKRLSKTSTQGLEEFKNEVICIAKLQHRNLVKLIGYCMEDDEMMLIYEYMPNNSLDSIIFDEKRRKLLDWPTRYHIINGIARGLLYLHQDSRLRIIHRDLKASNVLLDSDMNPKISDFGLARRFGGNEMGSNTRMVVGTYGYMSPEYAVHGLFSVKSDVFSFGVLLLEIVSGKKNRGFFQQDHSDNLLGHAWRLYKEDRSMELIDEALLESFSVSEAMRSIQVGLLCVQHSPGDRPNMSSVVVMLAGEGSLPEPKQPGFFTEDNILQAQCSSSVATQFSVNEVTITLLDGR
ncbi:G-type lectin S-receptor-like serine/threonine-protein kinase At4g27290 isoform X1 [Lactuca sativa]|uniref:G-type lectin S-receptor-like serine/threonine-protein kinase At4g27290 isoform X1 n=1 Tax=Lactuca sativa TaxID=4236 RepID=UPI000CD80466|nr:G-type lectin S-receptor-like serine/threonine-protein kinase At4g27290 isoform X1 [Lactuca sativa]XP_042752219.1 G-type lectin S-receptor-like serine/threonine-protein kinase At4g27290 isoform X1 [Lactuca sativa]XP_052621381.1 G-type lectin S-receptor-like serine/threonine-protein kinase At4g27290 isoform X1 [Lactuca sativa]